MNTNQLILNYMPLAESLAKQKNRLTPKSVQIEDLQSAAYFGLVDAAHRFRAEYNVSFGAFARSRIVGEMCNYLHKIRPQEPLPDKLYDKSQEPLRWAFDDMTATLSQRDKDVVSLYYLQRYTLKEISNLLSITEGRVSQLLKSCKAAIKEKCR